MQNFSAPLSTKTLKRFEITRREGRNASVLPAVRAPALAGVVGAATHSVRRRCPSHVSGELKPWNLPRFRPGPCRREMQDLVHRRRFCESIGNGREHLAKITIWKVPELSYDQFLEESPDYVACTTWSRRREFLLPTIDYVIFFFVHEHLTARTESFNKKITFYNL